MKPLRGKLRVRTRILLAIAILLPAAAILVAANGSPATAPLPSTLPSIVRHPPAKRWFPAQADPAGKPHRNPGPLALALHARGITGRNVGIAILDQCLLADHRDFADRLRWYDELDIAPQDPARWHGTAVASLAAGARFGAAPGADLYFIGIGSNWAGEPIEDWGLGFRRLLHSRERLRTGIHRILELNRRLPKGRKIRVISLSIGGGPRLWGGWQTQAAIDEARREGIFVSAMDLHPRRMGPVVVASPGGADEYMRFEQPAGSWWIAHTAGMYALAAEQDPSITPERFLAGLRAG